MSKTDKTPEVTETPESIKDLKTLVGHLVYVRDQARLGISTNLPASLKFLKLKQSTLEKYCPTFLERVSKLSWDLCYVAFKQNNPTATLKDFRNKFVTTLAGHAAYKKAFDEIVQKLPAEVTLEELEKLQQES